MTIENFKWPLRIRKQFWNRMVGRARIMRIVSIWKVILFFLTVSRPICGALTLEERDVQKTVALTTSLTKNEQVLTVNTGQFLVGEIVSVEITVKNGLDHDLDVTLQPACNCTNLSTTEMSAASGNDLTFQATITMPSSPQTLTSEIQFVDRKRAISFVLAINATIVDFVAIERTPIEFENSDHDAIVSVMSQCGFRNNQTIGHQFRLKPALIERLPFGGIVRRPWDALIAHSILATQTKHEDTTLRPE